MSNLRKGLIRLAHAKPELRPHLLPLLKQSGVDFSPPDNVGARKGALAWVSLMRGAILAAPPGSPERMQLINEAAHQLSYAAFLFRKRAVRSLFEEAAKDVKNLQDSFTD